MIVLGFGLLYIYGPQETRSPGLAVLEPGMQANPADTEAAAENHPDPSRATFLPHKVPMPEILVNESRDGLPLRFQANESDYSEYTALGPDNVPMIIPLPNTIRMQVGPPSEEFFLTNVSH